MKPSQTMRTRTSRSNLLVNLSYISCTDFNHLMMSGISNQKNWNVCPHGHLVSFERDMTGTNFFSDGRQSTWKGGGNPWARLLGKKTHKNTWICLRWLDLFFWLVVSTHLKNISQIGSFPQIGMKIKRYLKPPVSFLICFQMMV